MTFTYRHRKELLIGGILFLVLLLVGSVTIPKVFAKKKEKKSNTIVLSKKEETSSKDVKKKEDEKAKSIFFQVDVKGAVVNPGIYTLEEGSRVIDAIRLAGDLREDADTTVLNLSKKVQDEMVIIVYTRWEVEHFKETKQLEETVQEECQKGVDGALSNDACIDVQEEKTSSSKISLNQASKEELMTLPGIGESKADAIIAYRKEHGAFKTIEELKDVSGIGDALYNQIAENITL